MFMIQELLFLLDSWVKATVNQPGFRAAGLKDEFWQSSIRLAAKLEANQLNALAPSKASFVPQEKVARQLPVVCSARAKMCPRKRGTPKIR